MLHTLHLKTMEILSAKLCHDLLGPITGILAGLDMMQESQSDPEIFDLTKKGVDRLVSKLFLHRALFGNASPIVSLKESQKLFEKISEHQSITLLWPTYGADFEWPDAWGRLISTCLLWLIECLPRGGMIHVQCHADHITMDVTASHLTFKQDHLDILENPSFHADLHPTNLLPFLLKELSKHINTTLKITPQNKGQAMVKIFGDFKEKIPT